ncbi:MAG: hypothetical protein KDC38_08670 [Planctomycetes bacterium]|nr:hypothetical protein [Planctomycetota bacterium]
MPAVNTNSFAAYLLDGLQHFSVTELSTLPPSLALQETHPYGVIIVSGLIASIIVLGVGAVTRRGLGKTGLGFGLIALSAGLLELHSVWLDSPYLDDDLDLDSYYTQVLWAPTVATAGFALVMFLFILSCARARLRDAEP